MKATLVSAACAGGILLQCPSQSFAAADPFGVTQLHPTKANGRTYFATSWRNGKPREFRDSTDPLDPWFDAGHGSGRYNIDGKGTLTADGDVVRMYVHDPDRKTEWDENLEITAYITRVKESRRVSYSGPQIFARTNHGTFTGASATEEDTLCDDRGLGAKVNLTGAWAFEKETCHGADAGYATAGLAPYWPQGYPVGLPVGVKYVLRNVLRADGEPTKVKLELFVDMSNAKGGGSWTKVTEYTDEGDWGKANARCGAGVDPAMLALRSRLMRNSETQRPELTVYFRHEYAVMRYQRLSVREIDALREK